MMWCILIESAPIDISVIKRDTHWTWKCIHINWLIHFRLIETSNNNSVKDAFACINNPTCYIKYMIWDRESCMVCLWKIASAFFQIFVMFLSLLYSLGRVIMHLPWWRHRMEIFPALLAICAGNCLFCAWMNGWVNNREAGDLRHHRAHYDVTTMLLFRFPFLTKCLPYIPCGSHRAVIRSGWTSCLLRGWLVRL